MPKPCKATGNLKRDSQYPFFPMFLSILIADKKTKNSRRRIPERYPTIRKTQKVQKAKGNLKCWMVSRVNRGFWRPLMWQDWIAVCQQCRERQPLSNSHDGLNLTCLNRCDGVRSHGTSSSQGWHKRSVVQSELDPWVYILVIAAGNLCRFAQESFPTKACLCGHQCFSVVAQGTAKIRPRAIFQMNERWRRRRCKRIRSMGLHPLFSTKVIYDPCNYYRGQEWGVLQCRGVEGLKWYIYHGRPSLAMIGDLFVLPELCAQGLSTFYSRFHCRPLNHFGLSVSHQTRNLWPLRARNTSKDEMNCSIKVWPLVWHAQWQNLQHFDFRPSSTKQCSKSTVRPKQLFFTWESTHA